MVCKECGCNEAYLFDYLGVKSVRCPKCGCDLMFEDSKKPPCDTKNCLECLWYIDNNKHSKYCTVYKFKDMIPEIKNCDRGD